MDKNKCGVAWVGNASEYYKVRHKIRRDERLAQGVCVKCGKRPPQGNKVWCEVCTKKETVATMARVHRRQAAGECIRCGVPLICGDPSVVYCDVHRDKANAGTRAKMRKRVAEGKCGMCGSTELVTKSVCFDHWLLKMSRSAVGKCSKKISMSVWGILLQQEMRCAYTGKELVPGQNASVDHIVPRSRGGSNDLSNLQWVDTTVNIMKHNLLHEEFVEIVKIARRKI